jgi:hypothetical protein
MFGESSSNQCCSIQNSHVPQRHKFDFITASVNCAGSYSIATTGEKNIQSGIYTMILKCILFRRRKMLRLGASSLGDGIIFRSV